MSGQRRNRVHFAVVGLLLWLPLSLSLRGAEAAEPNRDAALRLQLSALVQGFDADVQSVLDDIEGLPRRLLALRSYLRSGEALRNRWSWTDAQVAAFRDSPGYKQMLADIERLSAQFEAQNPGYALYVNTEIRSLGVQLERWNKNRTVGLLADELAVAARAAVARDEPLRELLSSWQPSTAAPLAAPGMSLHGRAQALDFQIRKGDRIIAGTEAASVPTEWDAPGWTQKLQRAVERSGLPFRGPLQTPREPWHYEYQREGVNPRIAAPAP